MEEESHDVSTHLHIDVVSDKEATAKYGDEEFGGRGPNARLELIEWVRRLGLCDAAIVKANGVYCSLDDWLFAELSQAKDALAELRKRMHERGWE